MNNDDEKERQQKQIEECARDKMKSARWSAPGLVIRAEVGLKGAVISAFVALRSGGTVNSLASLAGRGIRITRLKTGGKLAIGSFAGSTLASIFSGSMLWDALKEMASPQILAGLEQCRKDYPLAELGASTLSRIALTAW